MRRAPAWPTRWASNTVFHAGYGLFWLPNDVAWDTSPNNDPINNYSTPVLESVFTGVPACFPANCSTTSAVAGSGAYTIANPFPGGIIAPPGRTPSYAQTLLGTGTVNENQLGNPYGYAQQWNADIQQQFGNGFLIDVAYGGAKGTHLPIDSPQIDQLPDQYLSMGNALLAERSESFLRSRDGSGFAACSTDGSTVTAASSVSAIQRSPVCRRGHRRFDL